MDVYANDGTQAAVYALTPLLKIGPMLDQQAMRAHSLPGDRPTPTTTGTTAARLDN